MGDWNAALLGADRLISSTKIDILLHEWYGWGLWWHHPMYFAAHSALHRLRVCTRRASIRDIGKNVLLGYGYGISNIPVLIRFPWTPNIHIYISYVYCVFIKIYTYNKQLFSMNTVWNTQFIVPISWNSWQQGRRSFMMKFHSPPWGLCWKNEGRSYQWGVKICQTKNLLREKVWRILWKERKRSDGFYCDGRIWKMSSWFLLSSMLLRDKYQYQIETARNSSCRMLKVCSFVWTCSLIHMLKWCNTNRTYLRNPTRLTCPASKP